MNGPSGVKNVCFNATITTIWRYLVCRSSKSEPGIYTRTSVSAAWVFNSQSLPPLAYRFHFDPYPECCTCVCKRKLTLRMNRNNNGKRRVMHVESPTFLQHWIDTTCILNFARSHIAATGSVALQTFKYPTPHCVCDLDKWNLAQIYHIKIGKNVTWTFHLKATGSERFWILCSLFERFLLWNITLTHTTSPVAFFIFILHVHRCVK